VRTGSLGGSLLVMHVGQSIKPTTAAIVEDLPALADGIVKQLSDRCGMSAVSATGTLELDVTMPISRPPRERPDLAG
jgi:hypothetical protein